MRLHRAVAKIQPETVVGFFKLATKLIRQELIDLGRHYLGPQGLGGNHASAPDAVAVMGQIKAFTEFHELVEKLAEDEREVVDLLFYQGMTEREAAAALGISDRTVKRRWREARLKLYQDLKDDGVFA
jgi:RNA polymerase sigma-70 factor (ECF subfamily)